MTAEPPAAAGGTARGDRYKWVALANTTASMFMATLDGATSSVNIGHLLFPLARGVKPAQQPSAS